MTKGSRKAVSARRSEAEGLTVSDAEPSMKERRAQSGLELHRLGRLAEAEVCYAGILAEEPDHPDALHLLGVLRRQTGRLDEARELLSRAVRLLPDSAAAHSNLGNALADLGRHAEAAACFRRALSLDPASAEALAGLRRVESPEAPDRSRFDAEYRRGRWDYLASAPFERPRQGVVSAYVGYADPQGSVLELGCGEGTLYAHLAPTNRSGYVGVDLSEEALGRARARGVSAPLVCAAVEHYVPDRRFDVIVFNEVLYYIADPAAVVRRYRPWLTDGGAVVVSWFRAPGEAEAREAALWRELDRPEWETVDHCQIVNPARKLVWRIRLASIRS